MADSYDLWLNQVCESEGSLSRYRIDIGKFEKWAKKKHRLAVKSIPCLWREAKYAGEAARERFCDQLKDTVGFYFLFLKESGITQFSVNRSMAVVMSFLHYHDIPVKSVRIKHPLVEYHNRDITKEEIRLILDHSSVRDRAMFEILYESGMRPDTLVKLRWKHLKEDYLNRKVPMKILLPSEILKCGVSSRFSFIGDEGYKALDAYLRTRHLPLKDEDYVFLSEKPFGRKLTAHAVSQSFNIRVQKLDLAEKRGNKIKELHLYCLKKAFNKFAAIKIDRTYVEFWIGHSDTKTHYISEDPEHHRTLYAAGYSELRLETSQIPVHIVDELKKKDQQIEKLQNSLNRLKPLADLFEDPVTLQKFTELMKSNKVLVNVNLNHDVSTFLKAVAEKEGVCESDLIHDGAIEEALRLAKLHQIKIPKELLKKKELK